MNMRRIAATILLGLPFVLLGARVARGQAAKTIQVMALKVPSRVSQSVDQTPVIPYSGDVGPNLYVRVFRGKKSVQTGYWRSTARPGECVLYPATDLYHVHSDGRMLHLDGVVDMFLRSWNAGGTDEQVFTLVFEQGQKLFSNGQVFLKHDDVEKYFANVVELTLSATDQMSATRQAKAAPPTYEAMEQGVKGFFTTTTVHAATKSAPDSAPSRPAPAQPVLRDPHDCYVLIPYSTELHSAGGKELSDADTTLQADGSAGMQTIGWLHAGSCGTSSSPTR